MEQFEEDSDMLRLPAGLMYDKKANEMVERYAQQRILGIVKDVMMDYASDDIDTIRRDDKEFIAYVSMYFPPHYPRSKIGDTFLGFYALLEAEDTFVPELVMEYVMASLFETFIEEADALNLSTVERINAEDREYILSKLIEECEEMSDDSDGISAGARKVAEERLNAIEDLREYEDLYFWDTDYALLNDFTEEALRASEMNKELAIGLRPNDNVFVIPKEWYQP